MDKGNLSPSVAGLKIQKRGKDVYKRQRQSLEIFANNSGSVRVYDKEKPIDTEKVKHCLELATLAPNSSDTVSYTHPSRSMRFCFTETCPR